MKISVITVCYNSAATIADTLRSVAAQTHPDIEHIVIDGASKDGTADRVRAHTGAPGGHVVRLLSEPDNGIYDAMNKGLAMATGDVVGFLNADDMYESPAALAQIAAGFASPDIDGIYGDLVLVDATDTTRIVRYWRSCPYVTGMVPGGWMPPHPTLYVRRSMLAASGGFDTRYRLQSDFDLVLRLFEVMKLRSLYLPVTLVRMRMGGASTGSVRNIIKGNREAAASCARHGFGGGMTFMVRKMARKIPQYFARPA
jgi:glycosyltransferase involved in cell wall biosynthesis